MIFGEISSDTKECLDDVVNTACLFNYMNIDYLSAPQQKKNAVKVSRLSPIGEALAKKPDTVAVTVAEEILDRLSPKQQKMLIEDAIMQIHYDDEKDKIAIEKPVIAMTLEGWRKYGAELAEAYEASVMAAQQIEEEKKEAKAAMKESKRAMKGEGKTSKQNNTPSSSFYD